MAQTVIGIFKDSDDAQRAVDELIANGFSESNIDYSANTSGTGNMRSSDDTTGWRDGDMNTTSRDVDMDSTNTTGWRDGDMNSPDTTFANRDSSVSTRDTDAIRHDTNFVSDRDNHEHESGIAKFFRNLFGNDDDSERFTKVAEKGVVITVHVQDADEAERAADLLDDYGAVDVDEHYKQYGSTDRTDYADETATTAWGTGSTGTGFNPAPGITGAIDSDQPEMRNNTMDSDYLDTTRDTDYRGTDAGSMTNNEGRKIPIIEENLRVGKREVENGGVRIRSRIVEKPVEETLRLREERIRVERNAVDREANPSDLDNFEEGTVEMRGRSEVPVVSKEARVIEEISLDRDVEHRDETIRDTVRSTEVDVEDIERERRNR